MWAFAGRLLQHALTGHRPPDEGEVRVTFDGSIITDASAEKRQDMTEVISGLMNAWEYRTKWYGKDNSTARRASLGWSQRVRAGMIASGAAAVERRHTDSCRDVCTPRAHEEALGRARGRQRLSEWRSWAVGGANPHLRG